MSHTIELSEEAYKTLEETAQRRGQTPEALLEALIDGAGQIYDDLDDFFRSLGATEEEIEDSKAIFLAREQANQQKQEKADDANV